MTNLLWSWVWSEHYLSRGISGNSICDIIVVILIQRTISHIKNQYDHNNIHLSHNTPLYSSSPYTTIYLQYIFYSQPLWGYRTEYHNLGSHPEQPHKSTLGVGRGWNWTAAQLNSRCTMCWIFFFHKDIAKIHQHTGSTLLKHFFAP